MGEFWEYLGWDKGNGYLVNFEYECGSEEVSVLIVDGDGLEVGLIVVKGGVVGTGGEINRDRDAGMCEAWSFELEGGL